MITVTGKGTITYTYDAAGNKLKKVTVDNTVNPAKTTTTLYIAGAVYQNDTLQFLGHEEGRMRISGTAIVYDYFLKDHLGNVRMVLTEETKTDAYPVATMETANATTGYEPIVTCVINKFLSCWGSIASSFFLTAKWYRKYQYIKGDLPKAGLRLNLKFLYEPIITCKLPLLPGPLY